VILLPILALLCVPALYLVFGRPRFAPRSVPARDFPRISIVIPARDERENLAILLPSIAGQDVLAFEIIVADDGSTDGTAKIAESHGARVIRCPPPPAGWIGKSWACQQGAAAATGDFLLFLDADTKLEPSGLGKIAALANESEACSLCPFHRVPRPYEQLSAFFNLTMVCGVNAFGLHPSSSAMFGQSLLVHREAYRKIGGHALVAGEVLENFRLAEHFRAGGLRIQALLGAGAVSMRMFPQGLRQLWDSWKKGASRGAGQSDRRALIFTSVWITGAMLCTTAVVIALLPGASPLFLISTAGVYLVYAIQCHLALRNIGSFSPLTSLFFPIPLLFYQTLFFSSVIGAKSKKKTQWKGRDVD